MKEIIKIRAEINEVETKINRKKISETKSWFFEKTNEVGKPLAILTNKKKKERKSSNK